MTATPQTVRHALGVQLAIATAKSGTMPVRRCSTHRAFKRHVRRTLLRATLRTNRY